MEQTRLLQLHRFQLMSLILNNKVSENLINLIQKGRLINKKTLPPSFLRLKVRHWVENVCENQCLTIIFQYRGNADHTPHLHPRRVSKLNDSVFQHNLSRFPTKFPICFLPVLVGGLVWTLGYRWSWRSFAKPLAPTTEDRLETFVWDFVPPNVWSKQRRLYP